MASSGSSGDARGPAGSAERMLVADGIACRHVGFDVTPARLVKALYTERGVVRLAAGEALGSLFPAR